jgi:hypothetical protein
MPTSYCPLSNVVSADLFDGRLEAFGVHEHFNEYTTEESRMLTDGRNYLWVNFADGLVHGFTRYAPNGNPGKILNAITEAFSVEIVSEHDPRAWGFDTQEEWDAAMEAMAKEDNEKYHAELVKFLNGEPHDIRPGTIGMQQAEIAKKLIKEDPALLLAANKSKLRDAIEATYTRDHVVTLTLSHEDLASIEMMATHEDDLPQG